MVKFNLYLAQFRKSVVCAVHKGETGQQAADCANSGYFKGIVAKPCWPSVVGWW